MTLPGNGTVKRIIAGIVAGAFLFMAGAVLANRNDISAICERIEGNKLAINLMRDQFDKSRSEILGTIERNRGDAKEDYKEIRVLLDGILKELKAK